MSDRQKIIIFDLDGTLYDTEEINNQNLFSSIISIQEYLNIEYNEAIKILEENRKLPNNEDNKKSLAETLENIGVPNEIIEKNQLKYIEPELYIQKDEILVDLIRMLKHSAKLAVFTNTRNIIAHKILQCLGFNPNDFDLVMTGDMLQQAKPSTRELRKCIEMLNGSIENSIIIGDRWHVDIEPAIKIGMEAYFVSNRIDVVNWIKKELHNTK